MQGGSRGSPRAGNAGGGRSSQLAGFGTAACDAGVSQSCVVFGLPFDTDTWNSFIQHSLAAKRSISGFYLFCYFRVTIQIVNPNSENSLLSHLLTLAPRCPVWRCQVSARVNSAPRERVGSNRLTACDIFKVTVTLPSPIRAVTVTRESLPTSRRHHR